MEEEGLTKQIIGLAFAVHREMGSGFLESVYEKALLWELQKTGLIAESQYPIDVFYKGQVVGHFVADLIVERKVVVELKAEALGKSHEVQLVNYLKATGINIGLLLNFGSPSLTVKRKYRLLNPVHPANPEILSLSSNPPEET